MTHGDSADTSCDCSSRSDLVKSLLAYTTATRVLVNHCIRRIPTCIQSYKAMVLHHFVRSGLHCYDYTSLCYDYTAQQGNLLLLVSQLHISRNMYNTNTSSVFAVNYPVIIAC